jgi:hypothetical protein
MPCQVVRGGETCALRWQASEYILVADRRIGDETRKVYYSQPSSFPCPLAHTSCDAAVRSVSQTWEGSTRAPMRDSRTRTFSIVSAGSIVRECVVATTSTK